MGTIIKLEEALLRDDFKGVSDAVSAIDRKTANEMMAAAGEHFGFPTLEMDGVVWCHAGMLSEILGYAGVSSLAYLMDTYHLLTSKIGWFPVELKTRAREIFNLSEKDSQATFVTWDTFLVAGMHGQTPNAKKVKLYLIEVERAFRVSVAENAGMSDVRNRWMEYRLRSQMVKDEIAMIERVDRMKDGYFKNTAIDTLERFTGKTYPKSKQLELNYCTKE